MSRDITFTGYSQYSSLAPSGLGNPGNLCYLNSLLQTFASSDHWTNFFKKYSSIHPLIPELSSIIEQLRQSFNDKNIIATKKLRNQLAKAGLSVSITTQQDFHEFYIKLLDLLESLFKQSTTANFCAFATKRIFPSSCIYEETIKCSSCGNLIFSINQTSFIILDVGQSTLTNALNNYFGKNIIRSRCSKCGEINNRIMTRKIVFLPKSILFFINRRQYAESLRPSLVPFEYPLSFSMRDYSMIRKDYEPKDDNFLKISLTGISETIQNSHNEYKLTSVVAFQGADNRGHYYSYRIHKDNKPPYPQRWFCTNDKKITPVSLDCALSQTSNVVLLHYEIKL